MIEFSNIIQNLKTLQNSELQDWENLIQQYPYFNAAYLFKAKKLKEEKHQDYDEFIATAAAYAPSRKRLYQIIHQDLNVILESNVKQEDVKIENEGIILDEKIDEPFLGSEEESIEIVEANTEENKLDETIDNENTILESVILEEGIQANELGENTDHLLVNVYESKEADLIDKSLLDIIEESKLESTEEMNISLEENEPTQSYEEKIEHRVESKSELQPENPSQIEDDIIDKAYITMDYSTILQAENKKTQSELIEESKNRESSNVEGTQSTFISWLKKYQSSKIEIVKPLNIAKKEQNVEEKRHEAQQTEATKKTELLKEKLESNKESVILSEEENRLIIQEAAKSVQDDERIVSETLAYIYAEQGNISKAKRIFEQLILLFPEKSDTFADAIRNLKKK